MAFHGIVACFQSTERWFTGVICTDGVGSLRTGAYQDYTQDQIRDLRRQEQRAAAAVGRYSAMVQLAYPSEAIRDIPYPALEADLCELL